MVFDPSEFEAPRLFLVRNIGKFYGTFKAVQAIHGIRSIRVRGTEIILLRKTGKFDGTFKSVRAIHGIRPIRVRGTEVIFT
jgi:hypothetical protein